MSIRVTLHDENGAPVAVDALEATDFKSGSKGFRGNFKAAIDGKRYQANINLVEIGSKPKS